LQQQQQHKNKNNKKTRCKSNQKCTREMELQSLLLLLLLLLLLAKLGMEEWRLPQNRHQFNMAARSREVAADCGRQLEESPQNDFNAIRTS